MSNESEKCPYGYDKMSATELRKIVSDITKSNLELMDDKHEFLSGVKEVLKESNKKIKFAVASLKRVERGESAATHESNVAAYIKSVPNTTGT